MSMVRRRLPQLEMCSREMFGDLVLTCQSYQMEVGCKNIPYPVPFDICLESPSDNHVTEEKLDDREKRRTSSLVEELLVDIYNRINCGSDYNSPASNKSQRTSVAEVEDLFEKETSDLSSLHTYLKHRVERAGNTLIRQLKRRDALRRQQEAHCDVITGQLHKRADSDSELRFSIQPAPGESGYSQWISAMKMVAQLSGGIPPDFRRRLWLTLADRHLTSRGINWEIVERNSFSEWSHPDDSELGVQIVKDLHRTGCSLFCGADGQENQALLKRVLLAYARWNKAVGYCQGFNMLAALILQVTDKCETDALKVMIYLIEGVLPDSYFADSLRGLSVDMAVFRELLRTKMPHLSKHLDLLQNAAKDGNSSYEPPLTNVFTMQWFLTLFCNCLPQPTVLRVWDLIMLEGNEILLRTALAIWQALAERIVTVYSADEFYCIMAVLTRELLEFDLIEANVLIKAIVTIGPLTELKKLREHYLYNINPWGSSLPSVNADRQVKVYPKERLVLDINTLKKQYVKLKQRQRQAHIIFNAAISRQPPPSAPVAMNHLLLGKSALVPAKRIAAPRGSIPPVRTQRPTTLLWKDTPKNDDSSSSSDTELCDEPGGSSSSDEEETDNPKLIDNIIKDETSSNSTPFFSSLASSSLQDEPDEDFEKFLEDRVRYFKDIDLAEDSKERMTYSRRNSERALQIIKENSLILHRILQCQSRLSPSPPLITPPEPQLTPKTPVFDISPVQETGNEVTSDSESREYGSRYTSILEKSKNLDEKYNSLILNSDLANYKTRVFDSEDPSCSSRDSYELSKKLTAFSELSLDLSGGASRYTVSNYSPQTSSPKGSPVDFYSRSPGSKSPNKIFNPFPIHLSSRQNKEVPFKLGLYKK